MRLATNEKLARSCPRPLRTVSEAGTGCVRRGSAGVIHMQDAIDSRLAELKELPFEELSLLAGYKGESVKHGRKAFFVSVWKDSVSDKHLRIVVQVYRHCFWGIGCMEAQGFLIDTPAT